MKEVPVVFTLSDDGKSKWKVALNGTVFGVGPTMKEAFQQMIGNPMFDYAMVEAFVTYQGDEAEKAHAAVTEQHTHALAEAHAQVEHVTAKQQLLEAACEAAIKDHDTTGAISPQTYTKLTNAVAAPETEEPDEPDKPKKHRAAHHNKGRS